jgi:hypothetical protein
MARKAKSDVAGGVNPFVQFMTAAYNLRQELDDRENVPNITISNWTTQSVGNRNGAFEVVSELTLPDDTMVKVKTSHFTPARSINVDKNGKIVESTLGYNGEIVQDVKGNAGGYWDALARGGDAFPVDRESLALVSYFFDTMINGYNSAESGFKIGLVDLFLKTVKPKNWKIEIRYESEQPAPYPYDLSNIKQTVAGLFPRFQAILDVQNKTRQRARRGRKLFVQV